MWIVFIVAAIVAIDQGLKYMVNLYVKPIENITVIPRLLDITYVENRGAAFGILQNQRWFFIVFAIIMILIFTYLIVYKKIKDKMFIAASALIIGGGIGNIIDRLFLGYVVDYLKVSFFPPVCNFADYCITIGTIILVIYVLFFYKEEKTIAEKQTNGNNG